MKHNREEYNKHIQALIKMMQDDYPNNFILEINSIGAEIRSTLTDMVFTDDNLNINERFKTILPSSPHVCNGCKFQKEAGAAIICVKDGIGKGFIPPDILTDCKYFKKGEVR